MGRSRTHKSLGLPRPLTLRAAWLDARHYAIEWVAGQLARLAYWYRNKMNEDDK